MESGCALVGSTILAARAESPLHQDAPKLTALGDAEFREHFAQVVLDGPGADVEANTDLRVGQSVPSQLGNLGLLCGQLAQRVDAALAGPLTGQPELAPGPIGEGRSEEHTSELQS